jgi:hypothetical protein
VLLLLTITILPCIRKLEILRVNLITHTLHNGRTVILGCGPEPVGFELGVASVCVTELLVACWS